MSKTTINCDILYTVVVLARPPSTAHPQQKQVVCTFWIKQLKTRNVCFWPSCDVKEALENLMPIKHDKGIWLPIPIIEVIQQFDELEEAMKLLNPTDRMVVDSDYEEINETSTAGQQSAFSTRTSPPRSPDRQLEPSTTSIDLDELLKKYSGADMQELYEAPLVHLFIYESELQRQLEKDILEYRERRRAYEKLLKEHRARKSGTVDTLDPIEIPQLPITSVAGFKAFEDELANSEELQEQFVELMSRELRLSDPNGHKSIWRCLQLVLDRSFATEWCTMQGKATGAKAGKEILAVAKTLFWKKIQGVVVSKFRHKGYSNPDAEFSGQRWIANKPKKTS